MNVYKVRIVDHVAVSRSDRSDTETFYIERVEYIVAKDVEDCSFVAAESFLFNDKTPSVANSSILGIEELGSVTCSVSCCEK